MLAILKQEPVYGEAKRLDLWEHAFKPLLEDTGGDDMDDLLEAVFHLGSLNLYTAFDVALTVREYDALAARFTRAGIGLPEKPELTEW